MSKNNKSTNNVFGRQDNDYIDDWFDTLIKQIQTDHYLLKENIASDETKEFYNSFFLGSDIELNANTRKLSSIWFIRNIIIDYLDEIRLSEHLPVKLALGLSDSKILVWSEIRDDDEAGEDILLLAEAKVNSKYHPHGFYINSTIVEESDKLPIPPHYQSIDLPITTN